MNSLFERLMPNERRGSKPRCHLLTHGAPETVAERLAALVSPFAVVSPDDRWMPRGFVALEEAQLHRAPLLLPPAVGALLGEWWLPADRQEARTPNFDLAGTCKIDGAAGLLLVEAKAHNAELKKEAAGRRCEAKDPKEAAKRKASHETIGAAIESARLGLSAATNSDWRIDIDTHYQMSNRFAWSWKLAELGIPVALVYLGFLRADDMSKPGEVPFADAAAWTALVRAHSAPLFPGEVWDRQWAVNGVPFIPLIRSIELPLESEDEP